MVQRSEDLPIRRSPTTEMDWGLEAPIREKILDTSRARPKNCAGSLMATRFRYGFASFIGLKRAHFFHHLPDRMRSPNPQAQQINLETESDRRVFLQQLTTKHLFQREPQSVFGQV